MYKFTFISFHYKFTFMYKFKMKLLCNKEEHFRIKEELLNFRTTLLISLVRHDRWRVSLKWFNFFK